MTQIILSGVISFLVAIFTTPVLVRYFTNVGRGQEIREDGPRSHMRKRGTPPMGGIAIVLGITIAYVLVNIYGWLTNAGSFTASGLLVLGLMLGLAGLGFMDDSIKLFKSRNLGLNKTGKAKHQAKN